MTTRREFLVGVAVSALVPTSAFAGIMIGSPVAALPFLGNPNVTILSIDTSGGIAASRVSGQTPCFLQVDASLITAIGTTRAYEDLEYRWDFGDPSGIEFFTNPTGDLTTVNANIDQVGPNAQYCYREPGTYTITLTIRGKNGSGYIESQVTQEIEITAFSGTNFYYDSVGGSDSNNGLTPETPKQTLTGAISSNRIINLKRGGSWTGNVDLTHSPLRIQPYGSGSDPILQVTSGSTATLTMGNGGSSTPSAKSDVVISGIRIRQTGGGVPINISGTGNSSATIDNVYIDTCTLESGEGSSFTMIMQANTDLMSKSGIWNTMLDGALTGSNGSGLYSSVKTWFFVMGGGVVGAGANPSLDHHFYINSRYHIGARWVNCGSGPNRNYCFNINNSQTGSDLEYGEWVDVSECALTSVARGVDGSNGSNNPSTSRFRNYVVEGNDMTNLTGDGVLLFYCVEKGTWRDNVVDGCDGGNWFAPDVVLDEILEAALYRNTVTRVSGVGVIVNYAGTGWTTVQVLTDNNFTDDRSNARLVLWDFADMASNLVDRNSYTSPSDSTPFRDVTVEKTWAQWQAAGFDANGSFSGP